MRKNPKMAWMMHRHRKTDATSVYSFHDSLSLLDNQECFNATIIDPIKFYKATLNKNDDAVFERDVDNAVVEEMAEMILFEVFLYKFKQQYVGKDTSELRSLILAHTTRALTSIKA